MPAKTLNVKRVQKGKKYYYLEFDFDSNLIVSNDIEPYTTADKYADAGNYFADFEIALTAANLLNELRRKLSAEPQTTD